MVVDTVTSTEPTLTITSVIPFTYTTSTTSAVFAVPTSPGFLPIQSTLPNRCVSHALIFASKPLSLSPPSLWVPGLNSILTKFLARLILSSNGTRSEGLHMQEIYSRETANPMSFNSSLDNGLLYIRMKSSATSSQKSSTSSIRRSRHHIPRQSQPRSQHQ